MKSGKRHITKGVELPNQVVVRKLGEKATCRYFCCIAVEVMKDNTSFLVFRKELKLLWFVREMDMGRQDWLLY